MIATRNVPIRPAVRTALCSVCGSTARVSPLKALDGDVICKTCRCQRCSIPISPKTCDRCGVAHGTPSTKPGLCERCFEIVMPPAVSPAIHNSALSRDHRWSAAGELPGTLAGGYLG